MSDNEIINIDSRSHLEVADSFHRYSKNLRYYFKEYNRMFGCSNIIDSVGDGSSSSSQKSRWSRYDPFFRWLDESVPRPNLSCCPRSLLDSDTVTYLNTDADRSLYEVEISQEGLLKKKLSKECVSTGPKGWIFVLKHSRMFACEKRTESPRLQHSSFFGGDVVNAAGMIVSDNGVLTTLFPHSGHYRPLNSHLCSLLNFFDSRGINLKNVQVDVQRVFKATRQKDAEGGKIKKTDTPYFKDGEYVFNFLRTKQSSLHSGFLFQIESGPLLKKTQQPRISADTSTDGVEEEEDECESEDLSIRMPFPSDTAVAHNATNSSSSSTSNAIPIQSNSSSSSINAGMSIEKPWMSSSYDPPSESNSPINYSGYLTAAFMEHFQRSNSASSGLGASNNPELFGPGSGGGNGANASALRAKVLGKHLMHSNSGGPSTINKDVALLLAESPSMAVLSLSNGSSRAHTPGGGYPRNRIRTLSETSKRAMESQDDLYSLGIATSGSRDVIHENASGSSGSTAMGGSEGEDVMSMLDIHASLLVN